MREELAIKRLTDTDLTFFRWHFQNQGVWRQVGAGEARQKAINVNADVLEALFPAFRGVVPARGIPITLRLHGPASAPAAEVTRKIIRQQKNWRLDGELVDNPVDDPTRFNGLRSHDLAVMRFRGDAFPTELDVVLLARANADDARVAGELDPLLGARTMAPLPLGAASEAVARSGVVGHSLETLLLADAEALAMVGEPVPPPGDRQADRALFRGRLSREDLELTRQRQLDTGRVGEELVDSHLQRLVRLGQLASAEWVADVNAISPYDFVVTSDQAPELRIDVKSTPGDFDTPFHVSVNELRAMAEDVPFHVYRLYEVDQAEGAANAMIAAAVRPLAARLLEAVRAFPAGVAVSSVVIGPSLLEWGDEFRVELPDEEAV